ncbi:MAG: N-acetylglucosamine-6-phosphate deacetylase [Bryobacteraceae bacterium]|nr:MAG: N-acetylglucosamine-6-phosphate deacetylase [Bryobacteraceae bacterium]
MKCSGIDALTGEAVEVRGERGVITSVEPLLDRPASLPWLAPGFIDLQVNGYAGADYCSAETPLEAIEASLKAQFACGTTRLLATVITGSPEGMLAAIRHLARARRELPHGSAIAGIHVEGPFISPKDGPRGAHPREHVRPPDLDEYRRWQDAAEGMVRMVTISPEWPGALKFIEAIIGEGVVAAIGHLDATPQQIEDAVRAGARISTHLGNGCHAVLPRHPNYLWHQLAEDRLAASFIVDGIHLGADFLRVALRAKGVERSVLITDAVAPAGCPPGPYRLGEVDVELHPEGRVTLRGLPRLAGSALRMDRGVENLMRIAGLSLQEALTMAARNPARLGRIEHRQRGLQPGERADVIEFDFDPAAKSVRIRRTWLDGQPVWQC